MRRSSDLARLLFHFSQQNGSTAWQTHQKRIRAIVRLHGEGVIQRAHASTVTTRKFLAAQFHFNHASWPREKCRSMDEDDDHHDDVGWGRRPPPRWLSTSSAPLCEPCTPETPGRARLLLLPKSQCGRFRAPQCREARYLTRGRSS